MLDGVPRDKADLFLRTFLEMYRESNFSTAGSAIRKRRVLMVSGTIVEAAAHTLVKTMWDNYRKRPFHYSESSSKSGFSASLQDLIKAMISISPSTKSQKAITPAFLRCMAQYTSPRLENSAEDHMADLIIGTFFFAMRSCEYTIPKTLGRTITIRLGGVKFFNNQRKEINHNNPHLFQIAIHVRLLFEDKKMEEV